MTDRKLPNWLQGYLVYTNNQESPEIFHRWCGISAVAAVMRRRIFFDMSYFLLYPNFYIVLVSPAGRCKKSTAMRMSKEIFTATPDIEFSADSTTRERFIQDMQMATKSGESAITVHSTEFASLLTSSGMDMVIFLTDIFDCPPDWTHKTKVGGTNKIVGPYLNMLGATTPDWIAKAMPLDTIGIGLTSRIVFVYADKPRRRPAFPKLSPEQRQIKDMLIHDLGHIAALSGEFRWASSSAELLYDDHESGKGWYQQRVEQPNHTGDPRLNGYFERKPMHLLKLCMIVSVMQRDDLLITEEDFHIALGLFDEVELPMVEVFANVGKNPLAIDYVEIQRTIALHTEGLTIGELMAMFRHSVRKDELSEVLDSLLMSGQITVRQVGTPPNAMMKYFNL